MTHTLASHSVSNRHVQEFIAVSKLMVPVRKLRTNYHAARKHPRLASAEVKKIAVQHQKELTSPTPSTWKRKGNRIEKTELPQPRPIWSKKPKPKDLGAMQPNEDVPFYFSTELEGKIAS